MSKGISVPIFPTPIVTRTPCSVFRVNIVSSRTHGLFVHLSHHSNVGRTLIYVHKRIKNTPRALERSGGGVQQYTYATPWHCSLCESYEKICECGLPFTHSAQDAYRPVRVVKCCSVDAKGCRRMNRHDSGVSRRKLYSQEIIAVACDSVHPCATLCPQNAEHLPVSDALNRLYTSCRRWLGGIPPTL